MIPLRQGARPRRDAQPELGAPGGSGTKMSNVHAIRQTPVPTQGPPDQSVSRHFLLAAGPTLAVVALLMFTWLSLDGELTRIARMLDDDQRERARSLDALQLDVERVGMAIEHSSMELDRLERAHSIPEYPSNSGTRVPVGGTRPEMPAEATVDPSGS